MKIIFLSHNATRTGAPLYLLCLCKYLKKYTDWEFFFLFKNGGELYNDFAELGITFILKKEVEPGITGKVKSRFNRTIWGERISRLFLLKKLKSLNLDLIYANTIANGEVLCLLKELKLKVITHVHELEYVINSLGYENLKLVEQYTDQYITSSPSVTKFLTGNLQINPEVITETKCFPIHTKVNATNKAAVKADLGLPSDSFVVGTSGTVEWRKGWDLFIRLAEHYTNKNNRNKIYFIWVGNISKKVEQEVLLELCLTGLSDCVKFVGASSKPMEIYSVFDVFCLMSREEAFGIVALEAALHKTPVLCFEGTAGLASFIKNDAGYVIPGLDTAEMAKVIFHLKQSSMKREEMGGVACQRVLREYTLASQAEKIITLISTFGGSTQRLML